MACTIIATSASYQRDRLPMRLAGSYGYNTAGTYVCIVCHVEQVREKKKNLKYIRCLMCIKQI